MPLVAAGYRDFPEPAFTLLRKRGAEDYAAALVQIGMSQNLAALYVETTQSRDGRRPENTTPTRFEDFADELARAYQAA